MKSVLYQTAPTMQMIINISQPGTRSVCSGPDKIGLESKPIWCTGDWSASEMTGQPHMINLPDWTIYRFELYLSVQLVTAKHNSCRSCGKSPYFLLAYQRTLLWFNECLHQSVEKKKLFIFMIKYNMAKYKTGNLLLIQALII